MAGELQKVRQKVEAGEKLSDAELDLLRTAAQAEPGAALKVALAQALLNADVPGQALRLLETLHRDYPHDTEVLLAQARALFALERWADAETPLQQLLKLQPNDLDALNAMALLCLRRGEVSRASALVNQVLGLDPFDGDAQTLRAELDATDLPVVVRSDVGSDREPVDLPTFTLALTTQLKSQSTPHLMQGQQLVVRLGKGGVARLDTATLHQSFLESGRPLEETVTSLGRELAERSLGLPEDKDELLGAVMPVLRDSAFLDRGVGSVRREGPAGLWVFYALEDPELLRYVPESALDTFGISLEQLDEAAWKRLSSFPTALRPIELLDGQLRLTEEPHGLWALATGDGHDAARLLTVSQQQQLNETLGAGPYIVYFGLRELVLICRETDAVKAQLEGLEPGRDGIAGSYRLDGNKLTAIPEWT